jgi:hypothetical protein
VRSEIPSSELPLDGYSIPRSDRAKYLDLILDKKLTFSPHFDYVSDRVQKLTRILYPLIKVVHSFSGPKSSFSYGHFSAYHSVLTSSLAWICPQTSPLDTTKNVSEADS